jgi:hypothetical protein
MSPRIYALIIGGVLAAVGFFALVFSVSIPADSVVIDSVECGTGFGVVATKPIGAPDDWRTQCDSAVSTRQAWAWGLLGLGALTLVGGLFVKTAARDESTPPAQPA